LIWSILIFFVSAILEHIGNLVKLKKMVIFSGSVNQLRSEINTVMSLYIGLKSKDIGTKSQYFPAQLAALPVERHSPHWFGCVTNYLTPLWLPFVFLTNFRTEAMQ